jgi:FSR family fosmidomycin resistance protein-like MFS transporter
LIFLPVLALLIGIAAAWQLGIYEQNQKNMPKETVVETARQKTQTLVVAALIVIAACQAWAQMNITTFLPKHLSDLGQSASIYGLVAAFFSAGTAFGGVLGGYLGDKLGKREVILWGLGLGSIPLALIAWSGSSFWLYPLVIVSGALTGAAFSVIVVLAQRVLPVGMGLASGLILGFIFSSGALGVLISGVWADTYGIPFVFMVNGGISLVGGLLALALRK